jgi:hypothetical protein
LTEKYAQRGKGAEAQRHKEKDKKQGKNVVDSFPRQKVKLAYIEGKLNGDAQASFCWFLVVRLRKAGFAIRSRMAPSEAG